MRLLAFGLVVAGILGNQVVAEACSCWPLPRLLAWPPDGGAVARNTHVWIEVGSSFPDAPSIRPEIVLEGPTGPVTLLPPKSYGRQGSNFELLEFIPTNELEPGIHNIMLGGQPEGSFVVEDRSDDFHRLAFEARSEISISNADAELSCGGAFFSVFSWTPPQDEVVVLARRDTDVVNLDSTDVRVPGFLLVEERPSTFHVGMSFCGAPFIAEPGTELRLSFGAFDGAGNFSGWTDPVDVRVPSEEATNPGPAGLPAPTETGCQMLTLGTSWPLLLLGLPLLARRRRSRSFGPR